MTDAGATWTDERVDLLKRLWGEGLTASQIAAAIGGVSRNAVIGKVHRIGLAGRGKAKAAPKPRSRKTTQPPGAPTPIQAPPREGAIIPPARADAPANPRTAPVPAARDEAGLEVSLRVTIMELREAMCRWPLGDPTKPDFRFCGARSVAGLPYCSAHAQIAYQPVLDRKRDRRLLRA